MRAYIAIALAVLASGCGPAAAPSGSAPPDVSPTPLVEASASPLISETPAPSSFSSVPPGEGIAPGSVVTTIEDGIRVRSLPTVGDESEKYEPLLGTMTTLYVLEGPVPADGYLWFNVVSWSWDDESHDGWVASGSRDGVPWLTLSDPGCPETPTDVASLGALGPGQRIGCFGGTPITLEVRLDSCDCDVDGPPVDPAWFTSWTNVLIDPTASTDPVQLETAIFLAPDPAGTYPDNLPVGEIVEVTGTFDHPAAAGCMVGGFDDAPMQPSGFCRWQFAVTEVLLLDP